MKFRLFFAYILFSLAFIPAHSQQKRGRKIPKRTARKAPVNQRNRLRSALYPGRGRKRVVSKIIAALHGKKEEGLLHSLHPILRMVFQRKWEDIKKEIRKNPNLINKKFGAGGATLLCFAAAQGRVDIVKYLVEKRADVMLKNNNGLFPLHYAVLGGNLSMVKFFESLGNDPLVKSDRGFTVLHLAALSGNKQLYAYFLEKGIDINSVANRGETPLHFVAMTKNLPFLRYVLDKGANPNAKNNKGETPIFGATFGFGKQSRLPFVKLFVERGADPKINFEGVNLLGVFGIQLEVARYLLGLGLDPNIEKDGVTLLHRLAGASSEYSRAYVKLLLDHGARKDIKDKNGKLPVDYAENNEMKKLLAVDVK